MHEFIQACKNIGIEGLFYLGIPILCWLCSLRPSPTCKEDDPMGYAQKGGRK